MTLDDLKLFAEYAKGGNYGRSYGQLTPATIMDWLRTYWEQRQSTFEEIAYTEHMMRKETTTETRDDSITRSAKRLLYNQGNESKSSNH